MMVVLFLAAILSAVVGLVIFGTAKGAVHEAIGGIFWIIAAVFFIGAAIVDALQRTSRAVTREILALREQLHAPPALTTKVQDPVDPKAELRRRLTP
jgi:hypothetical protein